MSKGILTIIVIILAAAGVWYWVSWPKRLVKPVEPQISKPVEEAASEASLRKESASATSTPETEKTMRGDDQSAESQKEPTTTTTTPPPPPEIPPSSPEPMPPPSPQPQPAPVPPPLPLPQPAIQKFSLEADDSGFYQNGQDTASLVVSSGLAVQITFIVRTSNVYYGGLDFRGCGVQSPAVPPGGSTTLEFTTSATCSILSYWPASGVVKDSLLVVPE